MISVALATACGGEPHDPGHQAATGVEPGLAPRVEPAPPPPPAPEPAPEPEPQPQPEPQPDPELSERKQALANVGRSAFDALQDGEFDRLAQLTPLVEGFLRDSCPSLPVGARRELEARFSHCHKTIDWAAVAEAQVFAGKPTGAPATGCEAGIEDYGRLQLFLHMNDKTIWRVDFFGAVGQDGNAVGINGEVSCTMVDGAPPLK
ncbi:hypothetical protein DB30_07054 [Enhygromyxa salina]|uniref:Uncharacterized protein n=1 Tax=Enhygromyxa salina TaxID=215803 RepID=A0A0C2CSQ8_9BACT|nr:hypothetical protein DB30_07054 [Enhygromyxa salina]